VMDLRLATNSQGAAEAKVVPGDHLRVWRGYFWHHGIYVGDERVVQFGAGIRDKVHSRIEEVPLPDFRRRGRVEIVPKQQKWPGLWGAAQWELPSALPPEEIVRRARWLAARRLEGTYNLLGRNCESIALWCVCNMCESLQRQHFQSLNVSAAAVLGPAYTYLNRRGTPPFVRHVDDAGLPCGQGASVAHVLHA
jgi:Lecithin retinol acyltransferase